MRKTIEQRIREAAKKKTVIKITGRTRCEAGFDVKYPDASCPGGHDVINVGSKAEALTLLLIKARVAPKLTFSIMPAKREAWKNTIPWCVACKSYHVTPLTKQMHEDLKCRAKWREA